MHTLSIVIPSYKRPKLLKRLLSSISAAKHPSSLLEILVVENGSQDGAESICNQWNNNSDNKIPIQYLYSDFANVSNARNIGITNTKADFVIFFDDDVRCGLDTLLAYDFAIQKHGFSYFYGGPLNIDYEKPPLEWLVKYLPWSAQGLKLEDKETIYTKPKFLGGNHAVSKKSLLKLGGYDSYSTTEGAGPGGEEVRLQEKLIKEDILGVYLPEALVWHYVPESRCSINWALKRHYRLGLTHGIFDKKSKTEEISLLFGAPRWLWKKYFMLNLRSTFFYQKRTENWFKIKYEAFYTKGLIDGHKGKIN